MTSSTDTHSHTTCCGPWHPHQKHQGDLYSIPQPCQELHYIQNKVQLNLKGQKNIFFLSYWGVTNCSLALAKKSKRNSGVQLQVWGMFSSSEMQRSGGLPQPHRMPHTCSFELQMVVGSMLGSEIPSSTLRHQNSHAYSDNLHQKRDFVLITTAIERKKSHQGYLNVIHLYSVWTLYGHKIMSDHWWQNRGVNVSEYQVRESSWLVGRHVTVSNVSDTDAVWQWVC